MKAMIETLDVPGMAAPRKRRLYGDLVRLHDCHHAVMYQGARYALFALPIDYDRPIYLRPHEFVVQWENTVKMWGYLKLVQRRPPKIGQINGLYHAVMDGRAYVAASYQACEDAIEDKLNEDIQAYVNRVGLEDVLNEVIRNCHIYNEVHHANV